MTRHPLPIFLRGSAAALTLAFISGAAGLAHQLVWTRRLVDVLGASADTFSKVVGAFFAGLALGAWLASRGSESGRGIFWWRVVVAETAVAVLALPALFSLEFADWLAQRSAPDFLLRFVLPLLLVLPPATAMGLAMPWMIRALGQQRRFDPKHAVWIYAVNTGGGIAGILWIVFHALPRWGVTGAGWSAVMLNLLAAAGTAVLAIKTSTTRSRGKPGAIEASDASLAQPSQSGQFTSLLAFASGFLVLALEVVLQHQFAQVTVNSLFASATVLAIVLFALALGAALVPLLARGLGGSKPALQLALVAASLLCAAQPFVFTSLCSGVQILPYELPPLAYAAEVFQVSLLAAFPLLLAAGLVFPLLFRSAMAGDNRGRAIGVLLAWNGLGGWLGAELGQTLIAPALGLWGSIVAIAGTYFLLLMLTLVRSRRREHAARVSFGARFALLLAAGVLVAAGFSVRFLPQAGLGKGERLAAVKVAREGVVATVERGPDDWQILFNNSYTLGGSKAQFNQERQAHLPLLLHGQAKTVATLGVATGSTVAGAALHPGIERIDAIELSPVVLRYAREFFGPYNRNVFSDRRVHTVTADARWVMARQPAAYDVVIGDLFLPWRTGEARLFAREHFQNVKRALKPDGVFCQWLPMFQLTHAQFAAIARTFREVFPDAFLVRGDFYAELPIIGLVGGLAFQRLDWPAIDAACARLREGNQTSDALVRHAGGVAMLLLGPLPDPGPGPVNTLGNAWLEWDAAGNIPGLATPWFIGVPLAEYTRNAQRSGSGLLPEGFREAHRGGDFFLTLEIAAKLNLAVLPALQAQVRDRLPTSLREDRTANWQLWPMRVKPTFGL